MLGNSFRKKIFSHNRIFLLLAFVIPILVRAIPEIIMGSFLVGFDTIAYYVPFTMITLEKGVNLLTLLGVAPMMYIILIGIASVGLPLILSLKVFSCLLLGFLGVMIYWYANKTLNWSSKKSCLITLIATLYFVSLRISWDMLRTELALVFLFAAMIFLAKNPTSFKDNLLLSLLLILTVLSHQLIAVIMFSIIIATMLHLRSKEKRIALRRVVVCSAPAVTAFLAIVIASFLSSQITFENGVITQGTQGLTFLFRFASITESALYALGFLFFCYLPFLPLLLLSLKKFRANLQIKAWILLVLFFIIISIIIPNAFIGAYPYRWILLLVFPLAFFVADTISRLKSIFIKVIAVVLVFSLSPAYIALPATQPLQYFSAYPLYMPTTMTQNTLPLRDCQDAINALHWIRNNMDNNSRLLTHEVFYGWALTTMSKNQLVFYGFNDPSLYAKRLTENGSSFQLFLIWWINGEGWYGQPAVSSEFQSIYQSGKIAIYLYEPIGANVSSAVV